MRAFNPDVEVLLEERIRSLAQTYAASHGAACKADVWWNSRATITDAGATESAVAAAARLGPAVPVDPNIAQSTGAEDFSYMLWHTPGNFMWLGNGSHGGAGGGQLHSPLYDFNDAALPWGIAYWLSVVDVELDGRLGA